MADFRPQLQNYKKLELTPFKWLMFNQFPFIEDSLQEMDNYSLLCKILEQLQLMAQNQETEQGNIQSLLNSFVQLQNYVNTYFDNNLPELVNNKLDEMAQDGTLERLIGQYIDEYIERSFLNVYDMKYENLEADVKCRTMGYYHVNDGGGASYIIRDEEPQGYYELMNNGKYAELIFENIISPEMFGAYGDNIHDDSDAFRNASKTNKIIEGDISKTYKLTQVVFPPEVDEIYIKNCNFYRDSYQAESPAFNDISVFKVTNQKINFENCKIDSIQNQIPYENLKVSSETSTGLGSNVSFVGAINSEVIINDCEFNHVTIGDFISESKLSLKNSKLLNGEHGLFASNCDINIQNCEFNLSNAMLSGYYHCFYIATSKTFMADNIIINTDRLSSGELNFRRSTTQQENITYSYINNSKLFIDNENGIGQFYNSIVKFDNCEISSKRIGGISDNGNVILKNSLFNVIESSEQTPSVFSSSEKIINCKIIMNGSKRLFSRTLTIENSHIIYNYIIGNTIGYFSSVDYTKPLIFNNCIIEMPEGNTIFKAPNILTIYNNCIFVGDNLSPAQANSDIVKMFDCVFKSSNPTLTTRGGWQYNVLCWDNENHSFVRKTNIA